MKMLIPIFLVISLLIIFAIFINHINKIKQQQEEDLEKQEEERLELFKKAIIVKVLDELQKNKQRD
jgi:uncharacterized membrane protein YqhA